MCKSNKSVLQLIKKKKGKETNKIYPISNYSPKINETLADIKNIPINIKFEVTSIT